MFAAAFHNHTWLLVGLTLIAIAVGVVAWAVARRRRTAHALWWLPLGFCLTEILGVTLTLQSGERRPAECVINHEITEPLYTTQGLWNLAVFVPLGLFGVLALRRPLPVLAGALTLPCLIELTQALAPFGGGICRSTDVEMSVGGSVLGLVGGLALTRGHVAWRSWARRTLVVAGALGVAGSAVFQAAITPYSVDGSSARNVHDDEREAAERAIRQAFGDRYQVGAVQVSPGIDGHDGSLSIQLTGGHTGQLMWPGGRQLSVSLENSSRPTQASFPVQGSVTPHDARSAYRVARTYMKAHYPWAEAASWRDTVSVGAGAEFGWLTSWRFKERGVVMPRSLDVQINRAGRVSQLLVDFGPKHVKLPAELIPAKRVEEIVRTEDAKHGGKPGALRIQADVLKADRLKGGHGPWRVLWSVSVTDTQCTPDRDGAGCEPSQVIVDAGTGEIYAE
ncbi:VanZ family protein [Streptomyces bottropensis]|uniref:VanZ family protein n=1 Tax=Streptomyces TaxID=1883 RepID=UPI0003725529|nr:VanZ family protein [Streptomyces bottropensis]MZD20287.1 VanZ family protein [Streptomyces sp. SID5476]